MIAQQFSDCTVLANGVRMPWIGLGVWEAPSAQLAELIPQAVQVGYRAIDTASAYRNEDGVGAGIRAAAISREELFVTTKVWNSDQGYERTLKAFEASRKRLGLDYLDLYLVHWAVPGKYLDTWRALETLYQDGAVRAIGVCNFHVNHLQDLADHAQLMPMVNQIELHPFLTQAPIRDYCRQHLIQVEAWSPLMRGQDLLQHRVLQEIAARHHKSPAQIVLRWHLQHEIVTIPKTVHINRLRENADLFDFSLTNVEIQQIDALNQNRQSFPYDPQTVTFG